MTGSLRIDGSAETGSLVAVFDDETELTIAKWSGITDARRVTALIEVRFSTEMIADNYIGFQALFARDPEWPPSECVCAETSTRNCPVHQNAGDPEWPNLPKEC